MSKYNKPKSVQIPEELFTIISLYFLYDRKEPEFENKIIKGLQDKFDRMVAREFYSEYQNAKLPPAERDSARINYLKSKGVNTDFIYPDNMQP